MKEAYYFSHDTNAFLDPKIRKIVYEYGISAYGVFWLIIEMLASQKDYRIKKEGFIECFLPLIQGKRIILGPNEGVDCYTFFDGSLIQTEEVGCHRIEFAFANGLFGLMIKVGLLSMNDEYFWSNSLIERMKMKEERSEKQRQNAIKRWHPNATAMQPLKRGNALKERKGKEKKDQLPIVSVSKDSKPEQEEPKPEEKVSTDVQKVVMGWKMYTGAPTEGEESKAWNKAHYGRMAKSADTLLNLFGKDGALDCIEFVGEALKKKGLDFTLETIVKRSDLYREFTAKRGR